MNKLVKEGKELKEGFVTSKLGETIQSFVDNSLHSNELYKKNVQIVQKTIQNFRIGSFVVNFVFPFTSQCLTCPMNLWLIR